MKTLVLFGDSLFGRCRKGEELYLYDKLLGKYEIYNCATGGWDSNDTARKAQLIGKLKADIVLISVGTNDASPWKQVPIEQFKSNLLMTYEPFSASRVIFFPPPPVVEERRESGREIHNETMKAYNDAVVGFCQEHSLEYWDSWDKLWPLLGTDDDPHNEDGVHFSDDGYHLVLSGISEVVA